MHEETISVIVPVYNQERYLSACLDSILSQSYRNLEIIVINDGSTDFSRDIALKYQEQDDRIKFYEYENEGLSAARNHGLDLATGTFISFVDSDDLLLPESLAIMMAYLRKYNAQIVEGVTVRGKIPEHKLKKGEIEVKSYTSEEAISDVLFQKRLLPSAWGKIYRKEIFEGLRFQKGLLYEDLNIFYKIHEKTEKIIWISYPVYFYRDTDGSILNSWKPQRLNVLQVTEEIEHYISDKYPSILSAAKDRRLSANFNMFAMCSLHGEKEEAGKCWEVIKSHRGSSFFNSNVRIKNKAGILLSYLGKNLFSRISKYYYK